MRDVTFRLRVTLTENLSRHLAGDGRPLFRRPLRNMNKGSCDSNCSSRPAGDTEAEQLPMGDVFQPAPGASTGCTHLRGDTRVQGSTPSTHELPFIPFHLCTIYSNSQTAYLELSTEYISQRGPTETLSTAEETKRPSGRMPRPYRTSSLKSLHEDYFQRGFSFEQAI